MFGFFSVCFILCRNVPQRIAGMNQNGFIVDFFRFLCLRPIAMVPMPVISTTVSRIKKFFLAFLDLLTIRLLFLPSMFTPPKYRTYFLFVLIIYEHTFFVNYFLYFNEHRFDFVPFLCYNMVTSIFLPIGQSTRK